MSKIQLAREPRKISPEYSNNRILLKNKIGRFSHGLMLQRSLMNCYQFNVHVLEKRGFSWTRLAVYCKQKVKVGAPLWGERDENQYKVYNYIYSHIADVKHQIKTWKIQQISLNLRNELPLRRCCDPSKINATMNCYLKKKMRRNSLSIL